MTRENYKEGEVVRGTIYAPTDIAGVDTTESERRRLEAKQSVYPVFSHDPARANRAVQDFRSVWADLKKQAESRNAKPNELTWPGEGGAQAARVFARRGFHEDDLNALARMIRDANSNLVYDDNDAKRFAQEITLVELQKPKTATDVSSPQSRMTALSVARRNLRARLEQLMGWTVEEKAAITPTLLSFVTPNVTCTTKLKR